MNYEDGLKQYNFYKEQFLTAFENHVLLAYIKESKSYDRLNRGYSKEDYHPKSSK